MIDLLPKPHIVGTGVSSALGIPDNSTADDAFLKLAPALTACHCETGTYAGNGAASLVITFQRKPIFVILYGLTSSGSYGAGTNELIYIRPAQRNGGSASTGSSLSWGDTSLTITATGANAMHNASSSQYYYFAVTE